MPSEFCSKALCPLRVAKAENLEVGLGVLWYVRRLSGRSLGTVGHAEYRDTEFQLWCAQFHGPKEFPGPSPDNGPWAEGSDLFEPDSELGEVRPRVVRHGRETDEEEKCVRPQRKTLQGRTPDTHPYMLADIQQVTDTDVARTTSYILYLANSS
ncbi:hypothetical protein KM043_010369 [Ampulex compressa]|nr:hypothetical protein KM043_010369 [Ampulex compressa]